MSRNLVDQSHFHVDGGVFKDQRWREDMVFNRVSFYNEMTLIFDTYLSKVDQNSKFYQWFSESEKSIIQKCEEAYVSLSYSSDTDKFTNPQYKEMMIRNGFRPFIIPQFKSHMKVHPDYDKTNFRLYKFDGYCREKDIGQDIVFTLPGFNSITLK
jgi:hypothetical protein